MVQVHISKWPCRLSFQKLPHIFPLTTTDSAPVVTSFHKTALITPTCQTENILTKVGDSHASNQPQALPNLLQDPNLDPTLSCFGLTSSDLIFVDQAQALLQHSHFCLWPKMDIFFSLKLY